jgi:hypothetical protein
VIQRSPVVKERGQEHIGKHLQKFTLSVLHGSFHEAGAREILEVTQLRLAVLELFLVIAVLPDETQPTLAQGEKRE